MSQNKTSSNTNTTSDRKKIIKTPKFWVCTGVILVFIGFLIVFSRLTTFNQIWNHYLGNDKTGYSILIERRDNLGNSLNTAIKEDSNSYKTIKKEFSKLKLIYTKKENLVNSENDYYVFYVSKGEKHINIAVTDDGYIHDFENKKTYYILTKNKAFDYLKNTLSNNTWELN